MKRSCRIAVAATTALTLWLGGQGALAQKSGGILKMPDFASPASMSIHEEVTRAAVTDADAGVQQPRAVRSAQGTQHDRHDRAQPRRELGVERGWQGADVQVAARRQNGMTARRSPPPTSSVPGMSPKPWPAARGARIRPDRDIAVLCRDILRPARLRRPRRQPSGAHPRESRGSHGSISTA